MYENLNCEIWFSILEFIINNFETNKKLAFK